jgi:dUTPase
MALEKKNIIKEWGKETLVLLKKIGYIENDYTGRIEIELNLTQGGLGDVRIKQEIRICKE